MKCDVCGKEIEKSAYAGANLCSGECFTSNYWLNILKGSQKSKRYIRVNGLSCYIDRFDEYDKGFGGTLYIIRYNDGTTIKCDNLWLHGEVPEAFKELLSNNAEFININNWLNEHPNCNIDVIPTFEEAGLK